MIHRHHIIPRHEWKKRFPDLKGLNASDNIAYLTTEQHAQAHHFLYELNNNENDLVAFKALSKQIGKEEARIEASRLANLGNKNRAGKGLGIAPWNKGKKNTTTFSPETIQRLREMNTGANHPQYGKHRSEETKLKMRQSRLNYVARQREGVI